VEKLVEEGGAAAHVKLIKGKKVSCMSQKGDESAGDLGLGKGETVALETRGRIPIACQRKKESGGVKAAYQREIKKQGKKERP